MFDDVFKKCFEIICLFNPRHKAVWKMARKWGKGVNKRVVSKGDILEEEGDIFEEEG